MAVIEVTSQLKTIILVSSADPVIVNFVTKMDSIPETTLLLENEVRFFSFVFTYTYF